ncbi:MAG: hypothetical protein IPP78_06515 [Holophagaceae bacterium]|nr:hypothetical protein [Holophagaceae bacterium]
MRGAPGKQDKAADRRHIAHTAREANAGLRRPPPSPGGLAPIRAPRGVKALARILDMPSGPFLAGASRLGANKWHLYSLSGP